MPEWKLNIMQFDCTDPFFNGLCRFTFNTYTTCIINHQSCLFCNHKKLNVSCGTSHLYIGCNPFRTTDEQNKLLAKAYNSERGLSSVVSSGVLYDFILKVNEDFQEAIEKLAVQSKIKITLATSQFEASLLESQASRRTSQCENPLPTVLAIFRDALDRKERNNSVTVFGIPGDLPKCEIDQMFDRICFALQINYKIRVTCEKIKNMLIYKFCCRRHRDHFFYNFQEFKLTGSHIGLTNNGNLYCFENMASKMYNLSREIHDKHQRKEIKKYLRHQGLIYVWSNYNNARHPKLFYFMEELHVRKENVIRLLNSKILFSKIVDNFFPQKIESTVNMRHSRYIQNYLRPEICVKYYPISSIVEYLDQEDSYKKDGVNVWKIVSFYNFRSSDQDS